MAIPWLVVLKSVPWTEVITNAPKVADGAKRLWNAVGGKTQAKAPQVEHPQQTADESSDTLRIRLAEMERTTAELHEQMLASSELIKVLADQNAELVKRIEANRVRLAWLTGATVALGVLALLCLALLGG